MREFVSDIAFTETVKKIQKQKESRSIYARMEQNDSWDDIITTRLEKFIAERDSFYIATVNAEGQPYIQHRGGPKGFLKVIDKKNIGFADFSGNRQYITYGNLNDNNKVCLFLMDYPNRKRVKIWGTAKIIEDDQSLINSFIVESYKGIPEHAIVINVEAWDFNCPKHISPRYTVEEFTALNLK